MKAHKNMIGAVLITLLCALLLSACGGGKTIDESIPEEPIDGLVTEETGSAADHIGWWEVAGDNETAAFAYVAVLGGAEVRCYDEDGVLIDSGHLDYSEQRALNGGALIVFVFNHIGDYGADKYTDGDDIYLDLESDNGHTCQIKLDPSNIFDTKFARDYAFIVRNGSDNDISAIYMGTSEGLADEDEEILASVLAVGASVEISGAVPGRMAGVTDWTLFITGTDGTKSLTYQEFDLFATTHIDICWDSEHDGYYCEFG